jgi:Na+-translocating ferredoxin:NAD+ oxidoreductase RnfC subunit
MRKLAYNELSDIMDDPVIRSAALCSECGVCEVFACPMQLKPRSVNSLIKQELAKAGIRHPKFEEPTTPSPMREFRKAPSNRVASKLGVAAYYDYDINKLCRANPTKLIITLKQGAGAPCEPLVSVGDTVSEDQLIAKYPDGKLGSDIHAPFAGRVTELNDHIVIER